jgi:hypothetical protein
VLVLAAGAGAGAVSKADALALTSGRAGVAFVIPLAPTTLLKSALCPPATPPANPVATLPFALPLAEYLAIVPPMGGGVGVFFSKLNSDLRRPISGSV